MKNRIRIYLATLLAISAAVIAVRAGEGAAWVYDAQYQSDCPIGQTSCQVWDQYECDASPIFNENCTVGSTKRDNVQNGYCDLTGWCETA